MTYFINPKTKILWHSDRLAAIKRGENPPPINVEIDLSFRCSLGCQGCHFAYTHTRGPLAGKRDKPGNWEAGGDLMDYGLAKSIITQMKNGGVMSITWTGGGEPTLHPHFDDIVNYTYRHSLPQGIYTHGGHINRERASIMKRAMTWAYISMDECTPEQYKKVKAADYFDRVCQAIRWLSVVPGNATIGVGFLLHPGNWQQTDDMAKLALDLGADYVQFRPTVLYTQDEPDKPAEGTAWMTPLIDKLATYDDPRILADVERFQMYKDWNGRPYTTCHWAAVQTVITPNGKVWTCVNKREHAGECLGDLSQESFSEIWARRRPYQVNETCRCLCRGHIGNVTLDAVMKEPPHPNFI